MAITFTRSSYTADSKIVNEEVTVGEGATLRTWYASVAVMSDVWESALHAEYWDEAAQCIQQTVWVKQATVDATPEVLVKVKQYLLERAMRSLTAKAKESAAEIHKGSRVRVTGGRTNRGVEGEVVVKMYRPYSMGYRVVEKLKLGIATSDVKVRVRAANGREYENHRDMVWVWAHNCELTAVPAVDMTEVTERANKMAEQDFTKIYKAA